MTQTTQSSEKTQSLKRGGGMLVIVPTPIGNLQDITLRALETLKQADRILCEDTRTSRKLMQHYHIETPLASYHDHSSKESRTGWLERLRGGEVIALISDAGTPLLSDPGYKLVRDAIDDGLRIEALPGASAALPALNVSGLPSDQFFFAGFLPPKTHARKKALAELGAISSTLIFYESPKRLVATLDDMQEVLGNRAACIVREISKLHEETARGRLSELIADFASRERVKGEIVIVIGAPMDEKESHDIDAMIREKLSTHSIKALAEELAMQTGTPKRTIYNRALELRDA